MTWKVPPWQQLQPDCPIQPLQMPHRRTICSPCYTAGVFSNSAGLLMSGCPKCHHKVQLSWVHGSICLIEREFPIKVLHCENRNLLPFWFLWPWLWPHDLHELDHIVHYAVRANMNFLYVKASKVIVWQTYTDTQKRKSKVQNYLPRRNIHSLNTVIGLWVVHDAQF